MIQVNAMRLLIVITTHPKSGQTLVAEWLLFIAGCVKGQLIAWVQHEVIDDLVIRNAKQFFDDQRTHDDVDRRVWTGGLFGIQNRKTFLVNVRKYILGKDLCP